MLTITTSFIIYFLSSVGSERLFYKQKVVGSNPTGNTNIKLDKMRKWIIKHWAFSYDSKVFGLKGRHLRVVNTLIVLFCAAGLYNVLTVGFDVLQALAFLPFLVIFFGGKLFLKQPVKFEELDWEQQLQVLQKPLSPYLEGREDIIMDLLERHTIKYGGKEKFVEAGRILFPFAVILISVIIYAIFGFNEAGFSDQRFF
jgi:hypothetical protein